MEEERGILLDWMHSTFEVSEEDVRNGAALLDCVSELIPNYLDALSINHDSDTNRAKLSNINRAFRAVSAFLVSKFNSSEAAIDAVDAQQVVDGETTALTLLLRLIVTTAVNCEDKDEYVRGIMSNEDLAQSLMRSIKTVMDPLQAASGGGDSKGDLEKRLEAAEHKYKNLLIEYEELERSTQATERELQAKSDELVDLATLGGGSSDEDKQRIHELQNELQDARASLQSEQIDHEETKSTFERAVNELKRQLQSSNADSAIIETLRSELEEAQRKCEQMPALETRLAALQQQLTEAADMKKQAETLKRSNQESLKRIIQLEEVEKSAQTATDKIRALSAKVAALEEEVLNEQRIGDRLGHQLKLEKELTQRLQDDKTRLLKQQGELEHQVDLLRTGDISAEGLSSSDDIERMIRLEHENESLKAQISGKSVDDTVKNITSLLETANAAKEKLQKENRELSLQVAKLESQVGAVGSVKSTDDLVYEKLGRAERKVATLQDQLKEKTAQLQSLTEKYSQIQEELVSAQTQLSLVGLDEKEMAANAQKKAQEEFADKLQKVTALTEELAKTKQELADVSAARDALVKEHSGCARQITQVLQEKDQVTQRLLALQDSGIASNSQQHSAYRDQIDKLKEQLSESTKTVGELKEALLDRASDETGVTDAKKSVVVIDVMKKEIETLKEKLQQKDDTFKQAQKQFNREQQLMTSAWSALSVEYQKLAVRMREREGSSSSAMSSARGQSFLEVQRQKAINRKSAARK